METIDSISQWQQETFPNATRKGILKRLVQEIGEMTLAENEYEMALEIADIIIFLIAYLNSFCGISAPALIDWKMQKNRSRNWNIAEDGTGQHVP